MNVTRSLVSPKPAAAPKPAPKPLPKIDPKKIPPADWTMFVHLNADNNLEGFGKGDLNEMEKYGSIKGKLNVIALVDGNGGYTSQGNGWTKGTRLLWVTRDPSGSGKITSREIDVDPKSDLGKLLAKGHGELDMGDAKVMNAAMRYVQKNIPSKHFMVDIWDHGDAWHGTSWDETSKDDHLRLSGGELARAFQGVKVDVFGEDACMMSCTETADVMQKVGAKFLVGSEKTEPGDGWNYTDLLKRMNNLFNASADGDVTAEQFAHAIVNSYSAGGAENATMAATDLTKYSDLRSKMDALSSALVAAGGLGNQNIRTAYDGSWMADAEDQIDIGDFAKRLVAQFPSGPVHDAAVAVQESVAATVFSKAGKGDTEDAAVTGLTAYAPMTAVDSDYLVKGNPWLGDGWLQFIETIKGNAFPSGHGDASQPGGKWALPKSNIVQWV
jgi:hypothetical protein